MSATREIASIRRAGFTWLELVIVIAIIGTLCLLIMKPVWKVRQAARRMTVL